MRVIGLSLVAVLALAQSSPDVVLFFRSLGSTLAQAHDADGLGHPDASPFLDKFDANMPGFADLRGDVETLVTRYEVGASIELLTDEGDDHKRSLQLDWIMEVPDQPTRRKLVKCTIEREKKDWKITHFEPIDLFRY